MSDLKVLSSLEQLEELHVTDRLKALKDANINAKPTITIDRALAFTEVTKANPDLAPNVRIAKCFRRACETAPMMIQPNELIVGHPCGKPRAGAFSPDIAWDWLESEMDTIDTRAQDPYVIAPEDKQTIKDVIFPFWKGKSLCEACSEELQREDLYEYGVEAGITDLTYHMTSGGGDSSPGYDVILFKKGINGILAEAQEHLASLDSEADDYEIRKNFYEASIDICEGVLAYSSRLADFAREKAAQTEDAQRAKELLEIAAINERVPANPPETFWEALQSIWTIQSLFSIEANQCSTSLGRVDQYLYPYFAKDVSESRITAQQAFELFGCFMIKCCEVVRYVPEGTATYFAGYMPFVNMCVGGVATHGGDGTNDLTYLIMDVVAKLKVYQPTLACRVHNTSPYSYMNKVVDVIRASAGMPAVHFDDAHIKMMLRKGYSFEDARDYSLMGCVEPQRNGRVHQWTAGGFTQWPVCIEMALHDGKLPTYGDKQWLDTGSISDFDTYEKFEAAVKAQLDNLIDINCRGTFIVEKVFREMNPTPYMSIFIEGCMEKGRDVMDGGANLYEGPGSIFAGMGTYADSMAAIKKVVFEDKKYTLKQVVDAMDTDWEGYEEIRHALIKAPKYGNDDDYVDLIAKDVVDYTEQKMNSYPSLFARQIHGTLSQSFNTPLGEMIGATPDGRMAYAPLSDGMSPAQGMDKNGPTAIINSASKINCEAMSLGMSHNFKFDPHFIDLPQGRQSVITLLKTASVVGNAQMQFNCTDNSELLAAQANPEEHKDLIVRVAGYSAHFVELCKDVQDEIISRTVLDA